MRVVVCTTEGTFRSDVIPDVEWDSPSNPVGDTMDDFDDPRSLNIKVHGSVMAFNPRYIVWIKIVENDEPF